LRALSKGRNENNDLRTIQEKVAEFENDLARALG